MKKNVSDPQMSDLMIKLEKKILSCFDGFDKEVLYLKDVIIKDLQVENQHSHIKVNNLENKVMSLEIQAIIWNSMEKETTWRLQEYQMT